MAEESDLSRTEPASARRLQEARETGDVPRSREVAGWVMFAVALGVLAWQAPAVFAAFAELARVAIIQAAQPLAPAVIEAAMAVLWAVLPVLAAMFAAALVSPMLISGWVYAPQLTQADLDRVHPLKPFARLFSADAWFDGGLALLKLALAMLAVGWALSGGWTALDDLDAAPGGPAGWIAQGMLALVVALALAAVLDAGWRWWRYLQRHAMTWQEVLAEVREAELPPEVQAQLRARQQQAGQGGTAGPESSSLLSHPPGGESASAGPRASKSIDEVIG